MHWSLRQAMLKDKLADKRVPRKGGIIQKKKIQKEKSPEIMDK